MSNASSEKRRTVRPSPTWKDHKLFYLCVFAGISFSVVWWGRSMARRAAPVKVYASVARVHGEGLPQTALAGTPSSFPGEIERQVLSDESLRYVVRELNLAGDSHGVAGGQPTVELAVAQLQKDLQVEAADGGEAGELVVSITHSAADPGHAARVANAIAQRGADAIRRACRERTERAYEAAREAVARAQRELLAAQTRLDAYYQRHFDDLPSGEEAAPPPEPVAVSPPRLPQGNPAASAASAMIDNPEWVALNNQLIQLEQQRDRLLLDRTEAHPSVQELGFDIARLRQQIEGVPRIVPNKQRRMPVILPPPQTAPFSSPVAQEKPKPVDTEAVGKRRAEARRQFEQLKIAVEHAQLAYDEAAGAERRAWDVHQCEPRVDVSLAQAPAVAKPAGHALGTIGIALFAGLLATLGTVMLSAGSATEPTFKSTEQVEVALPVRVLGKVSVSETTATRGHGTLMRLGLLLGGLAVMAGGSALVFRWLGNV